MISVNLLIGSFIWCIFATDSFNCFKQKPAWLHSYISLCGEDCYKKFSQYITSFSSMVSCLQFVSMVHPSISVDVGILRDCYESFAMYCFGRYLVACLGMIIKLPS